jgi:hypothetical protein
MWSCGQRWHVGMWLRARTVVFKLAKQFELVVVFILPHPFLVVRGLHGATSRGVKRWMSVWMATLSVTAKKQSFEVGA